jgi:hypothetical protein
LDHCRQDSVCSEATRERTTLTGFAQHRLGHHKGFAAAAQTEMRNLYLLGDATQDNMLFTPVKLKGIASLELQRDERIARSEPRPLQIPDKALNWGI